MKLHRHDVTRDAIALDSATRRIKDKVNGYLRVQDSPFTRAQVTQYRGYEIIGWQEAGLKPDHIYNVYRPASELCRPETVASLNNIPLLLEHTAYDVDNPPKAQQIGSAGTDAVWDEPYLRNSLIFTDSKAIDLLESGDMKELSLGYFYTPVFKPGKTDSGESYDVMMTDIIANHIALVQEGRAGPDVAVHDSAANVSFGTKGNPMNDNPESMNALKDALFSFLESYFTNLNQAQPQPGMDTDLPEEEPGVDPAAPELAERGAENDPAQDSDDLAEDDDDQAQDSDDLAEDDDDDQAQDSDDLAEDDDDQAQDSDDLAEDDELDAAAAEALKANGLSDAPDEVKAAFLKGMSMGVKKANNMASDSKRGNMRRAISRMVNTAVSKRVSAAMKRERAKAIAMDRCSPYLGKCKSTAFDSAGAVYRQALLATGKYSAKETARLSDVAAASAFNAFNKGRKDVMARDSRRALAASNRREQIQAQANEVFRKFQNR